MRRSTDPDTEQANLSAKLRLQYLLKSYAPAELQGMKLFRRLRLQNAFTDHGTVRVSEQHFKDLTEKTYKKRWLPDHLVLSVPTETVEDWFRTGGPKYRKAKALDPRLLPALGFVIADEYQHWGRPLSDEELTEKQEQIAKFIQFGRPQPAEIFLGLRSNHAEEITDANRRGKADTDLCRRFLQGRFLPDIRLVNSGATIRRTKEGDILQAIRDNQRRMLLVTSAAGDGKTTLLLRLAATLFTEGYRVLIKRDWMSRLPLSWPIGAFDQQRTVLFIDRAEDVDLVALEKVLEENQTLRVVMAAREIDWLRDGRALDGNIYRHFPLDRLDGDEIDALAALIVEHKAAVGDSSVEKLRARLRHSVHETDHPHMLAAVMSACSDADFAVVLKGLIESFQPQQMLRWTALCASSTSRDQPAFCTSDMMAMLSCADNEAFQTGRARFMEAHKKVRSEIVRIGDGKFDLRHPDISKAVLAHCYDADADGMLRATPELESDLDDIVKAVVRLVALDPQRNSARRHETYLYDLPASWFSSKVLRSEEVGRYLFERAFEMLGNDHAKLRAKLLKAWLERERANQNVRTAEVQAQWLPEMVRQRSKSLSLLRGSKGHHYNVACQQLMNAYIWWMEHAAQHSGLGDVARPEEGSVRAIFQDAWNDNDGALRGFVMIQALIETDKTPEGLGEWTNPAPFTLRRLYRDLWDTGKRTAALIAEWSALEIARGVIGDLTPRGETAVAHPPLSARWLFLQAWEDWKLRSDDESRQSSLLNADVIRRWTQVETAGGNIGIAFDADKKRLAPPPFSADWLFRQAWALPNRAWLANPNVIAMWGRMAIDSGFVGEFSNPEEFSARWILREALAEYPRSHDVLAVLASLESRERNFGEFLAADPAPYTLRWLCARFQDADRLARLHWLAYAAASDGNIGDFDAPEPGTARQLFRELYSIGYLEIGFRTWARMEQQAPDRAVHAGKPFSADWFFSEHSRQYGNPKGYRSVDEWLAKDVRPADEPLAEPAAS